MQTGLWGGPVTLGGRGGGVCECEVSAPELVKKRSDVDTESEKIERMGVGEVNC